MRKPESFLGVEIVTYGLMSNHFHVLLKIPDLENGEPISPEELLERMPVLYSKDGLFYALSENSGDELLTAEK